MNVAHRSLEPRDLLAVGELAADGALPGPPEAIADRLGSELLAGAMWGLVAERAGRLEGAAVVETDGPGRGRLTVAVAREARRSGIGAALATAVAEAARGRGLHKLVATCAPGDRAALGLARSAGAGAEALLRRHRRTAGGRLEDLVALGLVLVPAPHRGGRA